MRFSYYIVLTLLSTSFVQCHNGADSNIIGNWERIIDDGEYRGKEFISFQDSKIVKMGNNLLYEGTEDGFSYKIGFETSINGNWEYVDQNIVIHLYLSSFSFKVIPNSLHIYMTKRENKEYLGNYLPIMEQKLVEELKNQFISFYSNYLNKTFDLKNIAIEHNILHCTSDIAQISFERIEVKK